MHLGMLLPAVAHSKPSGYCHSSFELAGRINRGLLLLL
jgi:hypothetical protein